MTSVEKTGRAVVVEEQWRWFSVASEVAAHHLQEHAFDYLDAPVERVSGAEVPAPYARNLEIAAFPSEDDIIDAVNPCCTGGLDRVHGNYAQDGRRNGRGHAVALAERVWATR